MDNIGFKIWSEKIKGKGEDGMPTLMFNETKAVLAVFDGMGGAGSSVYNYENQPASGAYISACETKKLFDSRADEYMNDTKQIGEIMGSLEKEIFDHLQTVANLIDKTPSRIKSNLIKRLPTTISAIVCQDDKERVGLKELICLWAGDSRCYLLSPLYGLIQLTIDDLKGDTDALLNLRVDSPMSNYCNADSVFKINMAKQNWAEPFVLIAATDGCFGYLPTPFHFEGLLLETLVSEKTKRIDDWQSEVADRLRPVSGDDYSMSLLTVGFSSFEEMQDAFEPRNSEVATNYIRVYEQVCKPVEQLEVSLESAKSEKENTLKGLWDDYKIKYHSKYDKR